MDYLMQNKIEKLKPSTIENIDTGFYRWVNETLNLSTVTNNGYKKTPVLWLGAERAFQIKNNALIRDKAGKLILPLITINRESITKDPTFKGGFQAHLGEFNDIKGGAVVLKKQLNQEKTRNYKNSSKARLLKNPNQTGPDRATLSTSKVAIFDELVIPVPTYISIMYNTVLRTEYQQQMNSLVSTFITYTGQINAFIFEQDNWQYEAFVQPDFTENKNLENMAEDERMFETKIQIKVLGYLVGDPDNRDKPIVSRRETKIRVGFGSERTILGEPWVKS
tara:strand:+ start:761 stop:1597 length:837 start_codon:yes stop_codon:yes gene_type:complete